MFTIARLVETEEKITSLNCQFTGQKSPYPSIYCLPYFLTLAAIYFSTTFDMILTGIIKGCQVSSDFRHSKNNCFIQITRRIGSFIIWWRCQWSEVKFFFIMLTNACQIPMRRCLVWLHPFFPNLWNILLSNITIWKALLLLILSIYLIT